MHPFSDSRHRLTLVRKTSFDFCEPWPVELTFNIEMNRDRTGRVVDPDNTRQRLLTDNKDVATWVCILQAGLHGLDFIKDLSNGTPGWAPDSRSTGNRCDSSTRASILRLFLDSGHQYISEYPDQQVQLQGRPHSISVGSPKPPPSATTSIRTKAHELFETIISFVLRTLPLFPVIIPHVPGLMWFGRSSPWEHRLAQDVDVLGAAEAPRFRAKALEGEALKPGVCQNHGNRNPCSVIPTFCLPTRYHISFFPWNWRGPGVSYHADECAGSSSFIATTYVLSQFTPATLHFHLWRPL